MLVVTCEWHQVGTSRCAVEPSAQSIRNWVVQADRDDGRRADGLTSTEREELRRLQRE